MSHPAPWRLGTRSGADGQLGSLGLILNAIVLWTTRHIDAAVAQLRAEDIARLSPLKHRNLNVLGRYSFSASTPTAGAPRPLRDPEAPERDDDEDGAELTRVWPRAGVTGASCGGSSCHTPSPHRFLSLGQIRSMRSWAMG
ncbi:Tn3 family transposase [Nonomuraea roseola]|uniref:Tn3 family transposase n=1 Tax=Nonomuraea roseola TaxID=46179 RepID=A0ABV5QCL8_9ACTN